MSRSFWAPVLERARDTGQHTARIARPHGYNPRSTTEVRTKDSRRVGNVELH